MSVSKASDDVEALVALRDRLALEIDTTDSPQILAILSRQFLAVIAELAELKPPAASRVDEIAEKYARKLKAIRSPDTPNKAPAKRKTQLG
jgi:hypothetical protein